jgi:hypothetical protein
MVEVNNSDLTHSIIQGDIEFLPSARLLELEDLEDLLLMTVSPTNTDPHLYYLNHNGIHFYLVWIVIHDFYNLNGLPLVIFVRTDKEPNRFIKYKPESGEFEFIEKIKEPSAAYIKILRIKQLPSCLDVAL